MNTRAMLAIIRKDLKVVSQNKGVILPIILAPLIMFVVLPWLVVLAPSLVNIAGASASNIEGLLARMPAGLQAELSGLNISQQTTVFFLVYMMAPFFLIIPLMVASIIAADSFAGEKERKTMEALLYTPTTDRELFIAKLLSAWLAAIAVAFVGFALYAIMANLAAWSQMGRLFFPNAMWMAMILWVVPALPGLGLGVMVLVSSRAQGFQDAYQLGSLVVLPVILLVFGQISGVLVFNIVLVILMGLLIWLLDALLIWWGSRSFRRGRLLGA